MRGIVGGAFLFFSIALAYNVYSELAARNWWMALLALCAFVASISILKDMFHD